MRLTCVIVTLILVMVGCRPLLEDPAYPEYAPWQDPDDPFLDPDPLELGEERLGIGVFYEGDLTEEIIVDDVVTHYFIYENTYTQAVSDDRFEGLVSDALGHGALAWWGGGVHWDSPQDLTGWTTYHLSFKSSDPSYATFDVGITGGGVEGRVAVTDHGYAADGAWHHLTIPLSAFAGAGADLSQVGVALLLVGETTSAGATLLVDNVYLTKE